MMFAVTRSLVAIFVFGLLFSHSIAQTLDTESSKLSPTTEKQSEDKGTEIYDTNETSQKNNAEKGESKNIQKRSFDSIDSASAFSRFGKRKFDSIGNSAFTGFGKRRFDPISDSAFSDFGKRRFDSIGQSAFTGFGKRKFDSIGNSAFTGFGKRKFDSIGQSAFTGFGKRKFDSIGNSAFTGFGKRKFDSIGQSAFTGFGKRKFDSIGNSAFTGFGKRKFDSIGQSAFTGFGKRKFDSIGQSAFTGFGKRKFDSIGNSAFTGFGKRRFDSIGDNSAFSDFGKRKFDSISDSSFADFGKRRFDSIDNSAFSDFGKRLDLDDGSRSFFALKRCQNEGCESSDQDEKRGFDSIASSSPFHSFGKRSSEIKEAEEGEGKSRRKRDVAASINDIEAHKEHKVVKRSAGNYNTLDLALALSEALNEKGRSVSKRRFDRIEHDSAFYRFGKRSSQDILNSDLPDLVSELEKLTNEELTTLSAILDSYKTPSPYKIIVLGPSNSDSESNRAWSDL